MDYWSKGKRVQVFIFIKLHPGLTQLIRYLSDSNVLWLKFVKKVNYETHMLFSHKQEKNIFLNMWVPCDL